MFHVKHSTREWNAESLYAYGLRLLSSRARSEREVRDRFRQRGADSELAQAVLDRLRAAGFLDDEQFAQTWVESRRRASPRGDRLLRQELARKGVARDLVDTALSADPGLDPTSLALIAATKKARSLTSEPDPIFTRRLTDFLLRRGFDYDVAATVVRQLAAERDGS